MFWSRWANREEVDGSVRESDRPWPDSPEDADDPPSPNSPLTYTLGRTASKGTEIVLRVEHFCRNILTALIILSLSPILAMPISFKVTWSSSSRISPLMSFALNVDAWFPHLISESQRPTWLSDHVRKNSAYPIPFGGSKRPLLGRSAVGVLGKFWLRVLWKDRGGRGCWVWNDNVGEAGDEALEFGCDEPSKIWNVLLLATAAVIIYFTEFLVAI